MKQENRGFSLIELIIVIAIMAILVGIMAPQLMRYVEKTNVSADTQICDTVRTAINTALADPLVINSNDASDMYWVDRFTVYDSSDGDTGFRLDASGGYNNGLFYDAVCETCGFDPFNITDQEKQYRSSPAKNNGILCCRVKNDNSGFIIYIAHSDASGKKQDILPSSMADIKLTIHIPVEF